MTEREKKTEKLVGSIMFKSISSEGSPRCSVHMKKKTDFLFPQYKDRRANFGKRKGAALCDTV